MFFNDSKRLRFSIRKFAIGVASIAIGAYCLAVPMQANVQANTPTEHIAKETVSVHYLGVKDSDLTNFEKTLIKTGSLSQEMAQQDVGYVLVYTPKDVKVLPQTGDNAFSLFSLLTLASLPLILVVVKGKRQKVASLIVMTGLAGGATVLAQNIEPLFNDYYNLVSGQVLTEPHLDGYDYIGYIDAQTLPADSPLLAFFDKMSAKSVAGKEFGEVTTEKSEATVLGKEDVTRKEESPSTYPTVDLPVADVPSVEVVPSDYPTVDLPIVDIPSVDVVPSDYPTVDLPLADVPSVDAVPSDYPTVDLPISDIPSVDVVPSDYPTVDLPISDIPSVDVVPSDYPSVDLPVADVPSVDVVPSDYPTVDLPVADIPSVDAVPSDYPTVDLPIADIPSVDVVPRDYPTVDLPVADVPSVDAVPSDYPTVDLPLADVPSVDVVPSDYPSVDLPVADLPSVDTVPSDYPTVDLPLADVPSVDVVPSDYPTVDLPLADVPSVDAVPSDYPTVDLPVADVPSVDAVPSDYPTVDLPVADAPSVDAVPSDYPSVDLPVATIETIDDVTDEVIPFVQERRDSDALYVGETSLVEGQTGLRRHVYRRYVVDGVEVKREEVSDSLLKAPVNAVLLVGTKPHVERVPDYAPSVQRDTSDVLPAASTFMALSQQAKALLASDVDVSGKTDASIAHYDRSKQALTDLLANLETAFNVPTLTGTGVQTMIDRLTQQITDYEASIAQLEDKTTELLAKKIEFKDVNEAYLYRLSSDKQMIKVLQLENIPAQTDDLFIKVDLVNDKTVWVNVNQITAEDDHYRVTGHMPELVQFDASQQVRDNYSIKVAKKTPQANVYTNFKTLIEAIRNNPAGEYIIGSDLTATELPMTVNSTSYLEGVTFMGTLKSQDNQRYTIYDLKKSLFQNLYSATISNINLAKVDVQAAQADDVGALAQQADRSRIDNLSVSGSVAGRVLAAGLLGVADNNTTVTNSAFVGRVSSGQSAAGLVGRVTRGSQIDKSFADVTIAASLTSGDRLGGLVAELNENASLTNSYAKGHIANYGAGDANVGGAVGVVYGAPNQQDNGQIANVTSYVKVLNGHDFMGNLKTVLATEKNLSNNHVVSGVSEGWAVEHTSLSKLSQEQADRTTEGLYQAPTNTHATLTNASRVDYSRVSGYQASYAQAYRNLAVLLPLYDRQTIVKEAHKLTQTDSLNQKEIASAVPYMGDKIARNYYTNQAAITKLLIRYTDGSQEWLDLTQPTPFANTGIVDYTIASKGISYHSNQLIKDNTALIDEVMALINAKDFDYTLFNPANLAEWEENDRTKRLEKLYLRDSFAKVKPKMAEILAGLLDNTSVGDYTTGTLRDYMASYLKNHVNALLAGSTYLERWYQFSNVLDTLLYGMATYHREGDSLALVTDLGNAPIDTLKSFATQATYAQTVAKYTGISNVLDFVKTNYSLYKTNETSIDEWLKIISKAYIVTRNSTSRPDQKGLIFDRMSIPEFQYMLLPLLNVQEEHVYAIFSSNSTVFGIYDSYMDGVTKEQSAYQQKQAEVRAKVDKTADAVQRYFDVLYRLLNEASVQRLLKTNLQVFDTLRGANRYDWSEEYGTGAYDSVKAFISPINRWQPYNTGARAYAPVMWNTELVHFIQARVMDEDGLSTLTHEHMHNLDDRVILGGYGKRFGHGAESYAMGLFQSHGTVTDTMGMNLIFDTTNQPGSQFAIHNTTPERFQTMADFETYMKRAFDVLYTLEVAEADAMIQKGAYYIKDNYRVLAGHREATGHRADILQPIGNALSGKTLTRDLFVDLGLVSGTVKDIHYGLDDYVKVNLFDAHFGVLENPEGASGGLTFRRLAFELLAEKGYYGGMIPYISNQYASEAFEETGKVASDTFIFKKIFGEEYTDFKAFRKAMLQGRHDAANQLKAVTIFNGSNPNYRVDNYQAIVALLRQAMDSGKPYAVQTMKNNIYRGFFQGTNEFRQSIYKD